MAETQEIAARLMSDLQKDLGLTTEQAAGVVGNLMHESGGFGSLQEISPTVPGSRGGYGYAQWTGPRRDAFESFVENNGLDPTSYEANYGFLRHELATNPYERTQFNTVRNATTAAEAAQAIANNYLRPGIPHMPSRLSYAQQALALGTQPQFEYTAAGLPRDPATGYVMDQTHPQYQTAIAARPRAQLPAIGPTGTGPVMRPANAAPAQPRQGLMAAIGSGITNLANLAGQQAAPVMRAAQNVGPAIMRAANPMGTVAGRTAVIDGALRQIMTGPRPGAPRIGSVEANVTGRVRPSGAGPSSISSMTGTDGVKMRRA